MEGGGNHIDAMSWVWEGEKLPEEQNIGNKEHNQY